VRFVSTQLTRFEEAVKMRSLILKDFSREVDFQPCDDRQVFEALVDACGEGPTKIDIIGALHGDFSHRAEFGSLESVDDIMESLGDREFVKDFVSFGKLGRQNQNYIPWMQATYIMVANHRALKHLPEGAELDHLSYEQLREWAFTMRKETGEAKLGFPVEGLMHRFLQGYLYPSYTGSTLRKFRSREAEAMWLAFRDLWKFVNPRSLTCSEMDQSLLAGEVWVAWDHTARIAEALQPRPKEFVAFPAPSGPKGRGSMLVLAGLAIPKCVQDREGSHKLIEYLTRPDTQTETLRNLFFFPVLSQSGKEGLSPGLTQLNEAVYKQRTAEDAVKTLLPTGLRKRDKEFNMAYKRAFSQIVLRRRDIRSVLEEQTEILRRILSETGARCWPPDEPCDGPCPVE
jgi:multiple sugar transport system substrate-binding protein